MAQARASVEAMDRMIRNVTKFMTNQQTLMSALRNDYATVGDCLLYTSDAADD